MWNTHMKNYSKSPQNSSVVRCCCFTFPLWWRTTAILKKQTTWAHVNTFPLPDTSTHRNILQRTVIIGLARAVGACGAMAPRAALSSCAPSSSLLSSCHYSTALTTLSEDEDMLRETVARFAEEKIGPKVAEMDQNHKVDSEVLKGMFEQGLMGIEIPTEYGGGGMSFFDSIIAIEEVAKVDAGVGVICDVQNTLINNAFMWMGNEAQKEKYLTMLASSSVGSFCLSEWGSGTDAFALKTAAKEDGPDHYVLNGTKAWITNAAEANIFLVFANADFSRGYKGITAFIVERDFGGVSVAKTEDKLGIRASSTCEISFTDVRVPKENILGNYGEGYKIAIGALNEGRIGIAAQMLGLARGALSKTLPYLMERKQFNQPIGEFQAMQHQYARCSLNIEAAKLLVYNAARLKGEGKPFVTEAAMAKLHASEVAESVSSLCINMLGGVGFTRDIGVEKYYRDCKIGQIYEGTSNIQLQTIAKAIMKEYK